MIPYLAYSRSDTKTRSREPITAKLIANLLQLTGIDRVLTIDLHASQIQGFYNVPVDHLARDFAFGPILLGQRDCGQG